MNDRPKSHSSEGLGVGILEDYGPADPPFVPKVTSVEERFRDTPTVTILRLVSYGTLFPDVHASALAELARRGVEAPTNAV